jgi:hypothetical protein
MSGGHFEYGCFRISEFADNLKHEIQVNDVKNEDGYCPGYTRDTIAILKRCHKIIAKAGELAKRVEWLYSGDSGEESFREIVYPILEDNKEAKFLPF